MKKGRSLTELAAELERQNDAKRDFVADTRKLELTVLHDPEEGTSDDHDPTVGLAMHNGSTTMFDISEHTHTQIGQRLKIPKRYYDHMRAESPELLTTNVNHWFHNKPETRMVRTLDGTARAFMSQRYRCLDNYDFAQVAIETLQGKDVQVKSCEVTDSRLYLQFVTPRIQTEVKRGDVVQAGFVLSNSEIGMGSLRVEPMIYRLVCTNGMIAPDHAMKKYHVGRAVGDLGDSVHEMLKDSTRQVTDRAFWMSVRDILEHVTEQTGFEAMARKFVESTEVDINAEPVDIVERTKKAFNLTDREGTKVLTNLLKDGDMTQYGLVNAVTATANGDDVTYDRAIELERLGGTILELPKTDWAKLDATE